MEASKEKEERFAITSSSDTKNSHVSFVTYNIFTAQEVTPKAEARAVRMVSATCSQIFQSFFIRMILIIL